MLGRSSLCVGGRGCRLGDSFGAVRTVSRFALRTNDVMKIVRSTRSSAKSGASDNADAAAIARRGTSATEVTGMPTIPSFMTILLFGWPSEGSSRGSPWTRQLDTG